MEYYARKAKISVSCHHLRHMMATQMLNADADLSTIQDLLVHSNRKSIRQYFRISNVKVQRDYFKSIEMILERTARTQIIFDERANL
jgi:site-specific recombinase XerD